MSEIFCYDTGEKVLGYKNYLKTKHWIMLRDKFKKTQNKECVMCGSKEYLNIHHMTYERLGKEDFSDLVYLCNDCHHKIHDAIGKDKSKFLSVLKTDKRKKEKKAKPKKSCNRCLDYYRGMCLLGFKNKNHDCKHHKFINTKGKLITDEYTIPGNRPKQPKTTKI